MVMIKKSNNPNNNFRNSQFWQKLLNKQQLIKQIKIPQLFLEDQNRFEKFSFNFNNINNLNLLVDFSKQHIDLEVINILCNAAKHCGLDNKIQDLFNGEKINITENKKAWHTALRDPNSTGDIAAVLQKMESFTENLYKSNCKNVLCLGIGGSYLGPMMVCQALDQYTHESAKNIKFHFIANTDQETIDLILNKLNPAETIVIISSKSFTTAETLLNTKIIFDWFKEKLSFENYQKKIFAVTSNIPKAIGFGVVLENVFPFWDFVGGRYSVWSAVGLPIVIKLGMQNFKKFLHGAYLVDEHFKNTEFSKNIPILMGLISVWNINFMQYKSLALIPYLDALEQFPAYLQQLSMESNGKTIDLQSNKIDYDSAEVVWGGVGCNSQHSFMQMLHQGSQIIPVDFLVAANNREFLVANCLAQSQALMQGTVHVVNAKLQELEQEAELENFKQCEGSRPSSTILFPELTPEMLGALIALYEHKTFVQGVMWNINSFDQWGVELGKKLANQILMQLNNPLADHNLLKGSMVGLMDQYSKFRKSTLVS